MDGPQTDEPANEEGHLVVDTLEEPLHSTDATAEPSPMPTEMVIEMVPQAKLSSQTDGVGPFDAPLSQIVEARPSGAGSFPAIESLQIPLSKSQNTTTSSGLILELLFQDSSNISV